MKLPNTQRGWLALALGVLALLGVSVAITSDGNTTTVSVTVNTPQGPTAVTASTGDIESVSGGIHTDMEHAHSSEIQTAAEAEADEVAEQNPLSPLAPLAAPSQPGCRSQFIKDNYSSRFGKKPQWIVSHYTVSSNLPGFRDLNALTAYSSDRRNGVSWHYNVDREGNCVYTVREIHAAWTQAAANRLSIGIEIINRGAGDAPLFTASGLKKYAAIVSDIAYRWNIPIQRGKANKSTCAVIRKGLIDHNDLGTCGGNHHDITPYDIEDIIAAVRKHRATTGRKINYPKVANFGPKRRARCRQLAVVRKNAKQYGGWTVPRRTSARKLKEQIDHGESRCRFV